MTPAECAAVGCGDGSQAVCWLVRRDTIGTDGLLQRDVAPVWVSIAVPGLSPGRYRVTLWDTRAGQPLDTFDLAHPTGESLRVAFPLKTDAAIALRRL